MRMVCVAFLRPCASIQAFAEACYRLTPDIFLRSDTAVFLDIEKCRGLYSESSGILRIKALLKRFSLVARIAIADDIPTSLARALSGQEDITQLPIQFLEQYINPFAEDGDLQKSTRQMCEELQKLGLRTITDFLNLPIRKVVSRFGRASESAFLMLKGATRAIDVGRKKWRPVEKITEFSELTESEWCLDTEPLLFKSREVLGRLCARLKARGLRVSVLKMTLVLDKHSAVKVPVREYVIHFYTPQGGVHGILLVLKERLEARVTQEPLESPVVELRFEVIEIAPGASLQNCFFNDDTEGSEENEAFGSLVSRIGEKIGTHQVFHAELTEKYLPEQSWVRAFKVQSPSAEPVILPFGERPLRLFEQPIPLNRLGRYLMVEGKRWELLEKHGPERIKRQWWEDGDAPLQARDYYRVETKCGDHLWIFKSEAGSLYLHGIFE